jgi:hypothetical protein
MNSTARPHPSPAFVLTVRPYGRTTALGSYSARIPAASLWDAQERAEALHLTERLPRTAAALLAPLEAPETARAHALQAPVIGDPRGSHGAWGWQWFQ